MRGKREKLWRNGLVLLGLVGLGISGGVLAALISGASSSGLHSEAAPGQSRMTHGRHSERGGSGSPDFAQFHWGLPEEDPMDWFNRAGSPSTGAGFDQPDELRLGRVAGNEGEIPPSVHSFIASEAVARPLAFTLMALFPNGRLVAAGPSGPPPLVETPTEPNDPPLNQPVVGPSDTAAPFADAAEPSILALLAVSTLGMRWLRWQRR